MPPLSATPQGGMDAGDMPAWLSNPPGPPGAGERWGRRFLFLGGALLTVAVAAGATMLALDLYESNSAMEVVAQNAPAATAAPAPAPADTLPFIEKRPANVPPLVLLPPDPAQQKAAAAAAHAAEPAAVVVPAVATTAGEAAPATQTPAPTPPAPTPPAPTPPLPAPPVKPVAKQQKPPAPVLAKKVVKPVKVAAQAAKKIPPAAKPKLLAATKKPVAQRPKGTQLAKAQPRVKPIKGTMLQPSRDRSSDRAEAEPAPRAAIDRRCRPGELARECAARTQ